MEKGDISKVIKQAVGVAAKEFSKDVKRQMGAYMEEMRKHVDVALNQVAGVGEKVDKLQTSVDDLTLEMRDVKYSVEEIKYNTKIKLDEKVDKKHFMDLDRRVAKLEKNK